VLIQDVTRELANSFGMKQPRGALVARVLPDSPAEKAGIQTGDIILKYNGTRLRNSSMLPPLVGSSRVDRPADVTVLRNGKRKQLKVNIGELPDEDTLAQAAGRPEPVPASALGITVKEITPELRRQLRMENAKGVVVDKVEPGPASAAGLQAGDIIQMINNQRVETIQDYNRATADLPAGKTIAVLVLSRNGPRFLALRLAEKQ
jgi:serine protease Do